MWVKEKGFDSMSDEVTTTDEGAAVATAARRGPGRPPKSATSPALAADPMKEKADRPDGELMPADLASIQARHQEPDPKPVPLRMPPADPDATEPGPPIPPVASAAGAPKMIHQNERAPAGSGLVRYKIRCTNYGENQPVRYVLARNEEEACRKYTKHVGLDAVLEAIGDKAPAPRLAVKALPD